MTKPILPADCRIGTERLRADRPADVARAAELLRGGGTVAFATETVYGLGANALDPVAVAKIFAAKQRPGWDPLIVHVDGPEMLSRVATMPAGERGRVCERLMEAFWPGPLTLLLPRTAAVPDAVTAGRPLVGVRLPAHAVARDLIRLAGVPVAAPSANRFGHTSPTTAEHVLADLDGRIDAVLDAGATSVGVESTVVDAERGSVYRPGGVTLEMLESVCGQGRFEVYLAGRADEIPVSLPSPGVGIRHYAPRARLVLVDGQEAVSQELARHPAVGLGVMLPDGWIAPGASAVFRWGTWADGEMLARRLFAGLRELDEAGVAVIVCPLPERGGIGEAIRDRLAKASQAK